MCVCVRSVHDLCAKRDERLGNLTFSPGGGMISKMLARNNRPSALSRAPRSRFLRRCRSDLTRSLLCLKNELDAT